MSAGLITGQIRDPVSLQQLRPEWWDLWRRSVSATPFQTPAWLLAWWNVFHPGELLTITVRCDGRLVGLAPFYIEAGERGRRVLPLGISISDYLDILIDPVHAQGALDAIAAHMAKTDVAWDQWEISDLPPNADALSMAQPGGCTEIADGCSACPVLALSAESVPWDRALPSIKRRDLRLARNRASRRGGIGFIDWAGGSIASAIEALIQLHSLRWQTQGEDGVLADPRVQDFHRAAAPALAEAGLVRFYMLTIGEATAGIYYGFLHRGRAYAYLTGFDPAFTAESPGTILIGHAIEQATREGAREFDMLRGQEAYKYRWGAEDRWTRRRSLERTKSHRPELERASIAYEPMDAGNPLYACARGALPANVALMQAAMAAQTAHDVETALLAAHDRFPDHEPEAARLSDALALWRRLPDAFTTVKNVLRAVDHAPGTLPPAQAVVNCAAAFDQAADLSTPASVALYSLGDAGLLEAATREVIQRMKDWGLLASRSTLLDFGCGNGRFIALLAPQTRFALGIDVSPRMLAAARRSCAEFANTAFARTSGFDLSAVADESIDLFCAIDAFPYLVQCGGDLAAHHVQEAARVLRPDGHLLVINYSYRGSVEADRGDIARLADDAGFRIDRNGTRDFTLWDGVTFLLGKRVA